MVDLSREGIPPRYFGASAKNLKLKEDDMKKLSAWAKDLKGNAIFYGETGRGKTYAAIALMYFFEYKKIPFHDQKFIELSDLNQRWLSQMQKNEFLYDEDEISLAKLKQKRVLILDDIGVKKPSESFLDFLYTVINHRCNQLNLITIYTTNLNAKELTEIFGPRILSRISDGIKIKFEGPDLRQPQTN